MNDFHRWLCRKGFSADTVLAQPTLARAQQYNLYATNKLIRLFKMLAGCRLYFYANWNKYNMCARNVCCVVCVCMCGRELPTMQRWHSVAPGVVVHRIARIQHHTAPYSTSIQHIDIGNLQISFTMFSVCVYIVCGCMYLCAALDDSRMKSLHHNATFMNPTTKSTRHMLKCTHLFVCFMFWPRLIHR